jgi:PIN domain nuclease of toxin-antitoxin system
MLVAQAQLEVLALVTADQTMAAYDVELVDARS